MDSASTPSFHKTDGGATIKALFSLCKGNVGCLTFSSIKGGHALYMHNLLMTTRKRPYPSPIYHCADKIDGKASRSLRLPLAHRPAQLRRKANTRLSSAQPDIDYTRSPALAPVHGSSWPSPCDQYNNTIVQRFAMAHGAWRLHRGILHGKVDLQRRWLPALCP